jgi:hypothetical protein
VIYKFRSKASGDVIMLAAQGDRLLRLLGREPAAKGIVEPADLPNSIARLEAALAAAELAAREGDVPDAAGEVLPEGETPVSLRQRLWPMLELMRRSSAAGVPVVWGV